MAQPKERTYYGTRFSILGDSISTLEGYNPPGYNVFYGGEVRERTGVYEARDTWWGKVIMELGGVLLANNSWSGSRVTRAPGQASAFPSGCSRERTSGLHIGGIMPDHIIIYLGFNDWASGAPVRLGTLSMERFRQEKRESVFSGAYKQMLGDLRHNYPSADICCCTLCETVMPSNPNFVFPPAYGGTHIEEFNDVIRAVSKQAGCRSIELYKRHIPYESIDGTHPTASGMDTLAALILNGLLEGEGNGY